jgi:hypothetical protein
MYFLGAADFTRTHVFVQYILKKVLCTFRISGSPVCLLEEILI